MTSESSPNREALQRWEVAEARFLLFEATDEQFDAWLNEPPAEGTPGGEREG
jgi:hypothetical protein